MAEWQTQQTQNLPASKPCEFESHYRHEKKRTEGLGRGLSVFFTYEEEEGKWKIPL